VKWNDELIYQLEEGVATIKLNRPERKNALSTSLVNKLADAWDEVDTNDAVKVVVLTSADCGVFCAGMDLKEAAEIKNKQAKTSCLN
jgi:Enoyl-CoA hydratase/carnithine racemase